MSLKYDEYLEQHCRGVYQAFNWMKDNIPDIFGGDDVIAAIDYNIKFGHDASKREPDEYRPYDAYFYGNNRSAKVVEDFNIAWLMHIHRNPHHWQHWILHKDDPNEKTECIRMPDVFIIEMVCDWWSFSWNKGNLFEIFTWYENRKNHIMLHDESRDKLEKVLLRMEEKLHQIQKEGSQEGAEGAAQMANPDINALLNSGLGDAISKAINNGNIGNIGNIMNNAAQ